MRGGRGGMFRRLILRLNSCGWWEGSRCSCCSFVVLHDFNTVIPTSLMLAYGAYCPDLRSPGTTVQHC